MADYTEAQVTLLAPQTFTHSVLASAVVGAEFDVRTMPVARVWVYHGQIETTANATGVRYIVQGRNVAPSGPAKEWGDIITFTSGTTAAVAAEIAGDEAADQTSIDVDGDPTAAFLRGIPVFVYDPGAIANSEWGKVDWSVAGAPHTVNLVDGLQVAKDAADTIWTQSNVWTSVIDLVGIAYIRMQMLHTAATGSDIVFKAELREVTDIE